MGRYKNTYEINIHYPEDESSVFEFRKRMGKVYNDFIRIYILTLPINDENKNKLYADICDKFKNP